MTARPTTLSLMAKHCPRALDHYENGTPYDRRVFAAGSAAHDILHALALHGPSAVEPTVTALLAAGREGVDAEPPLPPDAVFAGRDMALRHYERVEGRLAEERAWFEVGFAYVRPSPGQWEPCEYEDPAAWLRLRLDVVEVVEGGDEEVSGIGLCSRDYKGWPGRPGMLGLDESGRVVGDPTIQLKAHAVALREHAPTVLDEPLDFIRLQVVNLQLGTTYTRDLWLAEDDALLDQWKRDLEIAVDASMVRPRQANPGVACVGCPYVLACEEARAFARGAGMASGIAPATAARRFAVLQAAADAAREYAREACAGGTIETPEGDVGFLRVERAEVLEHATGAIWDAWTAGEELDEKTASLARGLLAGLKLGVTQVKAGAGALFGRGKKAAREEFVAGLLGKKPGIQFGIQKTKAADAEADREEAA